MKNKELPETKNVWKYGLINLGIFLLIAVLLDLAIGTTLKHYYFKMKSGTQFRTTYAIEQTTADIITFGSSRSVHHYHPEVFEDKFKLSFYNAGRDGEESSLYHYAVLQGMLKRYTPKIVILDLMNGELGNSLYTYDKLSSLSPYYSTHPEMRPIISLRSKYEKLKMLSSIYPFNSLFMSVIMGNTNLELTKNADIKGYLSISADNIIKKPIKVIDKSTRYELDSIKINVLKSFIEDCQQANIKLYIVCSPYYEKYTATDTSMDYIKKLALSYKVNVFDYSQDNFFLQRPDLFSDPYHLNDAGARIFSTMLTDTINTAAKVQ